MVQPRKGKDEEVVFWPETVLRQRREAVVVIAAAAAETTTVIDIDASNIAAGMVVTMMADTMTTSPAVTGVQAGRSPFPTLGGGEALPPHASS